MPPLLQRHIIIRGQAIEAEYHVTVGKQPRRKVKSDETGGPGDEEAHRDIADLLLEPPRPTRGRKSSTSSPVSVGQSASSTSSMLNGEPLTS
jgi:hypothetical protein